MAITIRPVTTIAECRIIEQLQFEVWQPADIEITPDHLLLTIAKEGGVVLLAWNEAEQPVGFAFGFIGLDEDNRIKLASHQTGVLPAYQDSGVGHLLKLAQREAALARKLERITWTFDPLQGRNARLNLRKLGVVCRTYLRDLYGEMRDELNQGLPTDRFKVDWWIASQRVAQRLAGHFSEPSWPASVCPILNPASLETDGLLRPAATFDLADTSFGLVEVPANLPQLKVHAPDLALQWRLHTRAIFEAAFANGYTVIDLLRREGRNYYLLQKDWQVEDKG